VLFYVAVAAGAVTHVNLLLEDPVKLPFLNIELPLKAFFFLSPILFLITHAYTLIHFSLLADKTKRFHLQLRRQIPDVGYPRAAEIRAGLRRQLPSNIFVQFLAGPNDIRESLLGVLLKVIAWTTLVVGPIALILLLQIQFLPYHEAWITWTHRIAIFLDLLLVWWLWRFILSGRDENRRWRWWPSWAAPALGIVLSFAALLFSWTVATLPGEWRERPLSWFAAIEPASINKWLFSGEVNATGDNLQRELDRQSARREIEAEINYHKNITIDDVECERAIIGADTEGMDGGPETVIERVENGVKVKWPELHYSFGGRRRWLYQGRQDA
jgi:hypothetical protein